MKLKLFLSLKPGERQEIYREGFSQVFADGRPDGTIDGHIKARRADLYPGRYRWKIRYRQTGEMEKPFPEPSEREFTLTDEARPLFEASWKGEASTEANFEVRRSVLR